MKKYEVLVGVRYTALYNIEAECEADAIEIAEQEMMADAELDQFSDSNVWAFANDDYDVWEME